MKIYSIMRFYCGKQSWDSCLLITFLYWLNQWRLIMLVALASCHQQKTWGIGGYREMKLIFCVQLHYYQEGIVAALL